MSFSDDINALVRDSADDIHAAAASWVRMPLGKVATIQNGFPFDSEYFTDDVGARLIRIRDVTSGDTSTFYRGPVPEGYWVQKGDVVVGMDGDFNLRVWQTDPGLLNQRVCKIVPNNRLLDSGFLAFVLPGYLRLINEHTHSVTVKHLSSRTLQQIPLPLPPLAEQRQIVARIEALFARTRRARTDLERIAPLASRYREQRRKRAFDEDSSWELTGDTPRLPAYAPPARFDELRTIPTGWQWAEVATISDVGGGLTKNQTRANNPIEIPYLRVANVYADELRLDSIETIRVSPGERDRIGLLPGDLLVVEGNGSVDQIGRVAIWDGSIPNCGHQNHLIRVRPRDGIPPRFILHWLMSPYGRSVLETVASSSSGLHTLSLSKVSAIPIPIPPNVTAKNVATALDQAATRSAHAQREAVRALALLDRLEQSILARAFRGELVPRSLADDLQHPAQAVDPIVTVSPRRGRRAAA